MCQALADGGVRCNHGNPFGIQKRNLQSKKQYHVKKVLEAETVEEKTKHKKILQQVENDIQHLKTEKEALGKVEPFVMNLTPNTEKVLKQLQDDGLEPYIVGGSVRDVLLGLDSKDVDIEVYGGDAKTVISSLRKIGAVDEVGKSFGVLKIRIGSEDFDVSLPRIDSKTVEGGHKGFTVEVNPELSLEEATSRRDYTINALMYSHKLGFIIDKHTGLEDMKNFELRHVSDAFDEDPLRVLRGVQMSSRFGMTLHPDTISKAKSLKNNFNELAKERVQIEFQKLYSKGKDFDKAFKILKQVQWDENFPGLAEVNNETLHRNLSRANTLVEKGTISGKTKEEIISATIADRIVKPENKYNFLSYTTVGDDTKNAAYNLCEAKAPVKQGSASLRAWANDLPRNVSIRKWCALETIRGNKELADRIYNKANKLGILDEPEKDFINGKDLMELNPTRKPGPWMKETLSNIRSSQYGRQFKNREEGLVWIKENIHI